MTFPSEFKLGGIKWSIEVQEGCDDLEDPDETYLGRCYLWKHKIVLRRTEDNIASMSVSLLHEVIHAVDNHLNIKLTEKQVHKMANGLFEVLSDNPDLIPAVLGVDMDQKMCYNNGKSKLMKKK